MSQIPVTMEQIRKDGFQIVSEDDSKMKTQKGKLVVIWERISNFKFRKLEAYNQAAI